MTGAGKPAANRKTPPRRKPAETSRQPAYWPVYGFRTPDRDGWTLIAADGASAIAKSWALERFPELREWRAIDRTLWTDPAAHKILRFAGEPDAYDLGNSPAETAHVWDYRALCWRASGERIEPPAQAERVETVVVEFGPPSWGWIDLSLRSERQHTEIPLSEVFDPFAGSLTRWLEHIATNMPARLVVDSEGSLARLEVVPSTADLVYLVCTPVDASRSEFIVEMSRKRLVADFYRSLVNFWEGPALRDNWDMWILALKDPDLRDNEYASLQTPWSVRSQVVERYLSENAI
ncbi:hypothetical protein [Bosea sp. BK604]|uniref:hypothetical protein n=1 Tax=Bosea sp. BK604 TaxID=2512180 RepID=UPI0010486D24|nr:hypothetical protein [Bosea sp. BK604]TCR68481.1 hypothetical protein EV560_102310 [Bosea sp. BK604]